MKVSIVQRSMSALEIWEQCDDEHCNVHHRLICTCSDRTDAEMVKRALEKQ